MSAQKRAWSIEELTFIPAPPRPKALKLLPLLFTHPDRPRPRPSVTHPACTQRDALEEGQPRKVLVPDMRAAEVGNIVCSDAMAVGGGARKKERKADDGTWPLENDGPCLSRRKTPRVLLYLVAEERRERPVLDEHLAPVCVPQAAQLLCRNIPQRAHMRRNPAEPAPVRDFLKPVERVRQRQDLEERGRAMLEGLVDCAARVEARGVRKGRREGEGGEGAAAEEGGCRGAEEQVRGGAADEEDSE